MSCPALCRLLQPFTKHEYKPVTEKAEKREWKDKYFRGEVPEK